MDLEELAALTDTFTGADLAGLVRQASLQALRESLTVEQASETEIDLTVKKRHFMAALLNLRPSVSAEVIIQSFNIHTHTHTFALNSERFININFVLCLFFRIKYNTKFYGKNTQLSLRNKTELFTKHRD